jgi:hypothetical protein
METVENDRPASTQVSLSSPQFILSDDVALAMQDLSSAVSLEQEEEDEVVHQSALRLNDNTSVAKKRKKEDCHASTGAKLERTATKRSTTHAAKAATATKSSLSPRRRRSPRKPFHQGEFQNDVKAPLTVKESTQDETFDLPASTSTPSPHTIPRQPFFTSHQQNAALSPERLRSPQGYHIISNQHSTCTPRKSSPSVLRKRTSICLDTNPLTTTSIEKEMNWSQRKSDPTAAKLPVLMEATSSASADNSTSKDVHDTLSVTTAIPCGAISDIASTIGVEEMQYRLSLLFPEQKYPHIRSKVRIREMLKFFYNMR